MRPQVLGDGGQWRYQTPSQLCRKGYQDGFLLQPSTQAPNSSTVDREQLIKPVASLLSSARCHLYRCKENPTCTPKEGGHFVLIPRAAHSSSVGASIISSLLLWPSEDFWLALISQAPHRSPDSLHFYHAPGHPNLLEKLINLPPLILPY